MPPPWPVARSCWWPCWCRPAASSGYRRRGERRQRRHRPDARGEVFRPGGDASQPMWWSGARPPGRDARLPARRSGKRDRYDRDVPANADLEVTFTPPAPYLLSRSNGPPDTTRRYRGGVLELVYPVGGEGVAAARVWQRADATVAARIKSSQPEAAHDRLRELLAVG